MQSQKSKQTKSVTSEEILAALEKVASEHGVESFMFLGLNSDPSFVMSSKCTKNTILAAFEEANRNLIKELFKR
ncbi:hypothetical protein [Runella limosa]|uniref:hypothetical protein n=1 Tax=Runella limosa TaxID=370978 RepID=UPI00048D0C52|nr:hypothetical protein [Runella limosa]